MFKSTLLVIEWINGDQEGVEQKIAPSLLTNFHLVAMDQHVTLSRLVSLIQVRRESLIHKTRIKSETIVYTNCSERGQLWRGSIQYQHDLLRVKLLNPLFHP